MIEIIYRKFYFDREIYVVKINGKFTMVYKSSGLSGSGHWGEIIPFMWLNSMCRGFSPTPGYIFKDFLYDGVLVQHRKSFDHLPEVRAILKEIREIVDKSPLTPEEQDINKICDIAKEINEEIEQIIGTNDLFDWKRDIK